MALPPGRRLGALVHRVAATLGSFATAALDLLDEDEDEAN
jgi:hypothetical protein